VGFRKKIYHSRMRVLWIALLGLLISAQTAAKPTPEPETPTSADVTDRGRSLESIVDCLLRGGKTDEPRTLILLVDPAPALVTARFVSALEGGLKRLGPTDLAIGVGVVGDRESLRVAPGRDRKKILAAVVEALTSPRNAVRDVMSAVRALARRTKGISGRREIALISMENGDAEKDLEETCAVLAKTGTVLHVVGRSAFLSDSYWVRRESTAPRDFDMRGQDAAYDDLPWGWLLQASWATESVPSGFGLFGLSRLASVSGGRYFLYYPSNSVRTGCSPNCGCRLCSGDHADCGTRYEGHRLRDIAPALSSRLEARRALSRDPLFVTLLKVWGRASTEGLVYSRPPLRQGPGMLRGERRRLGAYAPLLASMNFTGISRRADKLADVCTRLAKELEQALADVDPDRVGKRTIAIVETTRVYFLVTRLNLRLLQAFCARAPGWLGAHQTPCLPPEIPLFSPGTYDYRAVRSTNQCFCHGTKALERLEIPGLAEAGADRDEAFAAVEGLLSRYDGTPFGRTARVMGISIFSFSAPSIRGNTTRRIPGTQSDGATTGGTARPSRAGTGDGSGGGTATGD
jgi:hypothetical protein